MDPIFAPVRLSGRGRTICPKICKSQCPKNVLSALRSSEITNAAIPVFGKAETPPALWRRGVQPRSKTDPVFDLCSVRGFNASYKHLRILFGSLRPPTYFGQTKGAPFLSLPRFHPTGGMKVHGRGRRPRRPVSLLRRVLETFFGLAPVMRLWRASFPMPPSGREGDRVSGGRSLRC